MKRLFANLAIICLCGAFGVALGTGQGSLAQANQRRSPLYTGPGVCEVYNSVVTAPTGGGASFHAIPWPAYFSPSGTLVGVAYDNPIFAYHSFSGYQAELVSGGGGSVTYRYRNGGPNIDYALTSSQLTLFTSTIVWIFSDTASFAVKVCVSPVPTNTPTSTNTPTNTPTSTNTPTITSTPVNTATPSNTPTVTQTPTITPTPMATPIPAFTCSVALVAANGEWVAADNGIDNTTGYVFYVVATDTTLSLWNSGVTLGYLTLAPQVVDVSGVSVQNDDDADASFVYCSPAPLTVEQIQYFSLQTQVFFGVIFALLGALIYIRRRA